MPHRYSNISNFFDFFTQANSVWRWDILTYGHLCPDIHNRCTPMVPYFSPDWNGRLLLSGVLIHHRVKAATSVLIYYLRTLLGSYYLRWDSPSIVAAYSLTLYFTTTTLSQHFVIRNLAFHLSIWDPGWVRPVLCQLFFFLVGSGPTALRISADTEISSPLQVDSKYVVGLIPYWHVSI